MSPDDSFPLNIVDLDDITCTIVGASPNGVLMVTQGQGSDPAPSVTPSITPTGNSFSIGLGAGRQDSNSVADTFMSLSGGADYVYMSSTGSNGFIFNLATDSAPSE